MATTNDSHLAKMAQAADIDSGTAGSDDALPEPFPAVSVRDESPAQAIARCVTLSANNPTLALLPQDPRRRRAVILAVDNAVYVASSLETAQAAEGSTTATHAFYLPTAVPIPVHSRGALWCSATTTSSQSRVSVLVEKDDE
jgi:hypothetical protein